MFNREETIDQLRAGLAELDSGYLTKMKSLLEDDNLSVIDKAITMETYTMTYRKIRSGMIEAIDILKSNNPF